MANWWWKADYFETCNCAYGCPCNLTMIPTDGTCQAIDAWRIKEGAYGSVRLDGLAIALILSWPNPIHHGNGKAVVYVDERADQSQREALAKIGTGQAGPGGPFEIFSTTYSDPAKVVYGPIQLSRNGKRATLRLGNVASADFEPIISDMDKSEANVHMVLPNGFIWKDGEIVNTKVCEVNVEGLSFRHENSSAFLSEVEYNI
jgi:hypothetical protein